MQEPECVSATGARDLEPFVGPARRGAAARGPKTREAGVRRPPPHGVPSGYLQASRPAGHWLGEHGIPQSLLQLEVPRPRGPEPEGSRRARGESEAPSGPVNIAGAATGGVGTICDGIAPGGWSAAGTIVHASGIGHSSAIPAVEGGGTSQHVTIAGTAGTASSAAVSHMSQDGRLMDGSVRPVHARRQASNRVRPQF